MLRGCKILSLTDLSESRRRNRFATPGGNKPRLETPSLLSIRHSQALSIRRLLESQEQRCVRDPQVTPQAKTERVEA